MIRREILLFDGKRRRKAWRKKRNDICLKKCQYTGLWQLAIPTMISQVVTMIYNLADTFL